MEFGSSRAYAYGSSDEDEPLFSFPGEEDAASQPKLKPSHFTHSLVEEIPTLTPFEDEQLTASLAVHRVSTPEIAPRKEWTHSLDRAKSDGYLLSQSPDLFPDLGLSPPPSATGKSPTKKKGRFKPLRTILKKLGRKRIPREGSIHVKFEDNGGASPGPSPPAAPVPQATGGRAMGRHRKRGVSHAGTNVLAVRFNTLAETPRVHTGDAVVCSNGYCTAVVSHLSKLTECDEPESGNKEQTHSLDPAKSNDYLQGQSPNPSSNPDLELDPDPDLDSDLDSDPDPDASPPVSATGKTPTEEKGQLKPLRTILKKDGRKRIIKEAIHMKFEGNVTNAILQKHAPELQQNIDLKMLIPYLLSAELLTQDEEYTVTNLLLPHGERIMRLLSFIRKKGQSGPSRFLQCIRRSVDDHGAVVAGGHAYLDTLLSGGGASLGPSPPAAPVPRTTGRAMGQHRKLSVSRAGTNILAVRFNTLTETPKVHTGDAVVCSNGYCTAVISHLSKLTECDDSECVHKIWGCEYCGTENKVDVSEEEIPKDHQVTYMMALPPVQGSGADAGHSLEDSLVVFCIDISGSMGVTTPVDGKIELRGSEERQRRHSASILVHVADPLNQYTPRERRDVTYISRLQSIQAAVDQQMESLAKTHPSQRVALITFNDEVVVIGDGKCGEITVAGDRLSDADTLAQIGSKLPLPSSIRECRNDLSRKIFSLEENGQTALGPALLLSVLLAAKVQGSRVIICTDGLANKGVGSLDDSITDESFASAQVFYKDLGDIAMENGVTVSLVTIRGTECRVLELGQVADRTGGTVNIVDPHTVATEFSNIFANPIIATNVTTKIVLHKELYFTSEDMEGCVLTVPVGNVNADTELFYGYGFRTKPRQRASPTKIADTVGGSPSKTPSQLPFQVQIDYSASDGSHYLKVITRAQPVTTKKVEAEREMNVGVVGAHAARKTASLAAEGMFTQARKSSEKSQELLKKSRQRNSEEQSHFSGVMENLSQLKSRLREKEVADIDRPSASNDSPYVEACSKRSSLDAYLLRPSLPLPSRASGSNTLITSSSTLFNQRAIDDDLASELLIQRRTCSWPINGPVIP